MTAAPNRYEGIFFNMPFAEYLAADALGSGNHKQLLQSPPDFWWHSWRNPLRPVENLDTPAFIFGRAAHLAIEGGKDEFVKRYAAKTLNWSTTEGKAEKARFAAANKIPLAEDDYARILTAATMIRANPHLATAFTGGMHEVSVFWEHDGVPLKARFDYLKPRAVVDLKTIRNSRGMDFIGACRAAIAQYHYDIQAAHYLEARRVMPSLFENGQVFGEYDAEWLEKVVYAKEVAFVLVFWQAEDAPITWACKLSPGNEILEISKHKLERARELYKQFRDRFQEGEAWILAEPIEEMDLGDLPPWFNVRF